MRYSRLGRLAGRRDSEDKIQDDRGGTISPKNTRKKRSNPKPQTKMKFQNPKRLMGMSELRTEGQEELEEIEER